MNIKTAAKSKQQTQKQGLNKSNADKKTLKPANASLPVGMGTDKTAYIVKLLDTVSQQLRRSETERELLWKELEETRRLLTDLEERTGKSERSYSFIREEVEQVQQNSSTVLEQLNTVEARAANTVERLEDVTEENARITRSIERLSQDKTRLNRKVNIIEESVTSTREALEAKALVLLTDKAIAQQTAYPQMDAATAIFDEHHDVTPAKTPEAVVSEEHAKIKKRLFGGASLSVLMILGVAAVWGFSHFGPSIQLSTSPNNIATYEPLNNDAAVSAASTINEVYQPILAEPTDFDALRRDIDETLANNQGDMNSVASMLNDMEPSADVQEEVQAIDQASSEEIAAAKDVVTPEVVIEEPLSTNNIVETETQISIAPQIVEAAPAPLKGEALAAALDQLEKEAVSAAFSEIPVKPLAERVAIDGRLTGFAKEIENAALGGNPEAQHDLAALYTAGQEGVPQDFEKAFFWFTESGRQNVANARYNLGVLYQQGLGTLKNIEDAMNMYRSAALLGHPEAQYNLGIAYAEGIGVPYSIDAAVHYFERSALTGVAESAYNLGLIFENGLVGQVDNNKALFWYNMASERNNVEAQNALSQLTTKIGLSLQEVRDIVAVETETFPSLANEPVISSVAKDFPAPAAPPLNESDIIDVRTVLPEQSSFDLIAPIQEQLMALGLYPGPADGINGPMTMDAIRSYQTMFNLQVDGQPTPGLIEHMMNNVASAGGR